MAVLYVVEVDAGPALPNLAGDGRDVGQLRSDHPREQPTQRARLLVGALAAEREQHVQPGRAARLYETRQLDAVAQLLDGARHGHNVRERRLLRIEVEDAPVGLLERRDPAAPNVQRDRPHVGEVLE